MNLSDLGTDISCPRSLHSYISEKKLINMRGFSKVTEFMTKSLALDMFFVIYLTP